MKVAMLAYFAAPYGGSFLGQLLALADRLAQEGHETLFVFPQDAEARPWAQEMKAAGRQICYLPGADCLNELKSLVIEHKVDRMHTHFGLFDVPAARISKALGLKLIIHRHGESGKLSMLSKVNWIIKCRWLYAQAGLIAVGESIAEQFLKFGFNPDHLTVIRNGIDYGRLSLGKDRDSMRASMGLEADDKLVLLMGYDIHIKGVDTACEAMKEAHGGIKKTKDLALAVVVSRDLEAMAHFVTKQHGGMPEWLHLLPPSENVGEYYRAADAFLSASRTEGFSNSLLEALSLRLPIIFSDIESTKWVREYPETVCFPVGNPSALAEALLGLDLEKSKPTEKASDQIRQKCGLPNWVDAVMAFYEKQRFLS